MAVSRFNISAAYDLAETTMTAILAPQDEIYLEDHVGMTSPSFWEKALSPQKHTILHAFLESWEQCRWEECVSEINPSEDFGLFDRYLGLCDVRKPSWFTPAEIDNRRDDLYEVLKSAYPTAANAAFQLLFQNRGFLLQFHSQVASKIASAASLPPNAVRPIPRCAYIPTWLKKGVFYRDRGLCQECGRDVSGTLNLEGELHLDHLLPLESGGTNDSSNFQILCSGCNWTKGGQVRPAININHAFR
jgi:hypothetical protein